MSEPTPPSFEGISLLIVDDEPLLRETLRIMYEMEGATVDEAESGHKAWHLLSQRARFDAVISDVRMPDGGGVELLAKIRTSNFESPSVFLVTARADISAAEAYEAGADAVVYKPFDVDALLERTRRLILPMEPRWSESRQRVAVEPDVHIEANHHDWASAEESGEIRFGRGGIFLRAKCLAAYIDRQCAFRVRFREGGMRSFEGSGWVRWCRTGDAGNTHGSEHAQESLDGCAIEFEVLPEASRAFALTKIRALRPKAFLPSGGL